MSRRAARPLAARRRLTIRGEFWPEGQTVLDAAAYLDVSFLAIGPYLNGEWFYDTRYDGGHQNEKDHEAFERAVRSGRVKAVFEEAQ